MSKERGEELAIEYGIKFMETSAKASINVEEAFFTLARDIKCKMEKRLVNIIIIMRDFIYFFLVKSHFLYYNNMTFAILKTQFISFFLFFFPPLFADIFGIYSR